MPQTNGIRGIVSPLTRTASQQSFSAQQFCFKHTIVPHSRQMELSLGTL